MPKALASGALTKWPDGLHVVANEIVRSCFESPSHRGCTNTSSFEVCFCDSDRCNLNRVEIEEASSSALQWFSPSRFLCQLPSCSVAGSPAQSLHSQLASDLLRELNHYPINFQFHLHYCDLKSLLLSMILITILMLCLKLLLCVLKKLPWRCFAFIRQLFRSERNPNSNNPNPVQMPTEWIKGDGPIQMKVGLTVNVSVHMHFLFFVCFSPLFMMLQLVKKDSLLI